METGSSILNYTGNAQAGQGGNSAIPVVAKNSKLEAVNKAMDDFRLFDHQNNILKYNQKIKDRDTALQMLADGKVQTGKILPGDQKYFDEAEKVKDDAYNAIKGMDDKGRIKKYFDAVAKLKDVVTNTSHRWLEITKLNAEKANETLPDDIAAYEKAIQTETNKPLGELITPFQKSHKLDLDNLNTAIIGSQMLTKGLGGDLPVAAPTKTETIDKDGKVTTKVTKAAPSAVKTRQPVTGGPDANGMLPIYSETPEMYYDLTEMEKIADQLYVNNPKQAENIRETFKQINQANPQLQEDLLTAYNNRIADYIQQTGVQPDEKGNYKEFIRAEKMPDGKFLLRETPSSFAAKQALASIQGDYIIKSQKIFDEKAYELNLKAAKNKADVLLQGAKAQTERAKAGWYWGKLAGLKDDEKRTKMISDGYVENLVSQSSLIQSTGKPNEFNFTVSNQTTTPFLTLSETGKPVILKPIGGSAIYEQVGGESTNKVIGYKNGYYRQQYLANGTNIPERELANRYEKDFKNAYSEEQRQQWGITSLDAWLKFQIKEGNFDVKLVGENGATTQEVHTSSLKKALGTTNNYTEFYSENETPE